MDNANAEDVRTQVEDLIAAWENCGGQRSLATLISGTVNALIHYRLAEIAWELIEGNQKFLETYRPNWEWYEIYEIFFQEAEPFTNKDTRFRKIRNKAIDRLREELASVDEYVDRLKAKVERRFPYDWIRSHQGIMRNLNKKGNRHFLDVYGLLLEERMGPAQEGTAVLVKPNYDLIEKGTGLKRRHVQRYLREMCRMGIAKRENLDGERGEMIYSIGNWVQGKSRCPKPVFYLKNTPSMVRALTTFDAYGNDR